MMYVAKHYVLNVDWLRLYNTNPGAPDPDGVFPYEKLIIGPTYIVHPGDSLLSIAGSSFADLLGGVQSFSALSDSDSTEQVPMLTFAIAPIPLFMPVLHQCEHSLCQDRGEGYFGEQSRYS